MAGLAGATQSTSGNNPFGLLPAIDLYENDAYRQLAAKVGRSNTYNLQHTSGS